MRDQILATLIRVSLLLTAFIHLLPVAGLLGPDHLTRLYGIPIADPNLEILMRHRAVLFGLLGGFLAVAGFRPALQPLAFLAGFVSVASFLLLAILIGHYNPAVGRVVTADWIAIAIFTIGLLAYSIEHRRKSKTGGVDPPPKGNEPR